VVSYLELAALCSHDLPDTATIERLAKLKGLDITRLLYHTTAHVWVHGHVQVAHQDLSGLEDRHWDSGKLKILLAGEANRTMLQTNFTAYGLSHRRLLLSIVQKTCQTKPVYCLVVLLRLGIRCRVTQTW
jgi:hypothetical protein